MSASEICALSDAAYNHRITNLRKKKITLLSSHPKEWMRAVFTEWLGIQTPHAWQIESSLDPCEGFNVFYHCQNGCGKSALTLAPVIACHLRRKPHVAIFIYPMEALTSDQVSCTVMNHALP